MLNAILNWDRINWHSLGNKNDQTMCWYHPVKSTLPSIGFTTESTVIWIGLSFLGETMHWVGMTVMFLPDSEKIVNSDAPCGTGLIVMSALRVCITVPLLRQHNVPVSVARDPTQTQGQRDTRDCTLASLLPGKQEVIFFFLSPSVPTEAGSVMISISHCNNKTLLCQHFFKGWAIFFGQESRSQWSQQQ